MSSEGVHGRRKTGVAEKPSEASRRHEAEQIATYCQLKDQLLQRHREKCYDEESRSLSLKLVHMNPEFYTCWNYRRNALLSLFSHGETTAMTVDITADKTHDGAKDANAADAPSGGLAEAPSSNDPSVASSSPQPVDVAKMLDDELMLTLSCLKKYPKSYWVWNQRQWCLENHPQANWAQELKFVDKMLQMDARNFHGWGYRRYVVAHAEPRVTARHELAATRAKIADNFSNYSAWQYRAQVFDDAFTDLLASYPEGLAEATAAARYLEVVKQDLELVRNALFTDPDDQSAWLYHARLLGMTRSDVAQLLPVAAPARRADGARGLLLAWRVPVDLASVAAAAAALSPDARFGYAHVWWLPLASPSAARVQLDRGFRFVNGAVAPLPLVWQITVADAHPGGDGAPATASLWRPWTGATAELVEGRLTSDMLAAFYPGHPARAPACPPTRPVPAFRVWSAPAAVWAEEQASVAELLDEEPRCRHALQAAAMMAQHTGDLTAATDYRTRLAAVDPMRVSRYAAQREALSWEAQSPGWTTAGGMVHVDASVLGDRPATNRLQTLPPAMSGAWLSAHELTLTGLPLYDLFAAPSAFPPVQPSHRLGFLPLLASLTIRACHLTTWSMDWAYLPSCTHLDLSDNDLQPSASLRATLAAGLEPRGPSGLRLVRIVLSGNAALHQDTLFVAEVQALSDAAKAQLIL